MAVIINGIDIKDMISGGTYNTKNNISPFIVGLPSGIINSVIRNSDLKINVVELRPSPFGITYGVNKEDINKHYEAYSTSEQTSIPIWAKKMKVILIGGGQGTSGWSGLYSKKTNIAFFGKYTYADAHAQYSSGGSHGSYKEYDIDVVVGKNTYSITIGKGSPPTGTGPDTYQSTDITERRTPKWIVPNVGGDTVFVYNDNTYIAQGGNSPTTSDTTINITSLSRQDTYFHTKDEYLKGVGGMNTHTARSNSTAIGTAGYDGYFRIYFFA